MVCTFLAICSSFSSAMAAQRERTFIMVKPDGVQRGLIGEIISRFEKKGLKLVGMKFMQVSVIRAVLTWVDRFSAVMGVIGGDQNRYLCSNLSRILTILQF